ncbi:MAG: hypothetical protein K0Q65_2830 [Clostridia bacterium]|jgi:hypothetical protein|nr:hypothetical protein [Clostridia bacterium]
MIRISKTDGLIGINTTSANMSISQPKADFEMAIKHPKVEMHTEQIQVRIDQRQCFNESGLKDFTTLARDHANDGKQAVLEGIARRVNEGNMMAAIENNVDAIAEIAFNNSFTSHVFDIETMPKSRPVIDFVGGTVDIRVDEGYVDIKSNPNKPLIDVEVGDVEIYLRQRPEINIEFIGNEIDKKL